MPFVYFSQFKKKKISDIKKEHKHLKLILV